MILRAAALIWLLPLPLAAEEPWQDQLRDDPAQFGEEVRKLLKDEPELISGAMAAVNARNAAAVWAPLRDEIQTDLSRIDANRQALFAATPQGFGAPGPAQITLFSTLGCAQCARAEADLYQLAATNIDLRVELRSASTALPDRIAFVIARDQGDTAARAFRRAAAAIDLADDKALDVALLGLGQDPATLRSRADAAPVRAALADQAALFTTLGLDTAPSYVLPRMLLRGQMPAVVLSRYLEK